VFIGFFLRVDSLWPLVQSLDNALFQPQQKVDAKGTYCGSYAPNARMHKCTVLKDNEK